MLIRWVTKEDKTAWIQLSQEYDKYIDMLTDNMVKWYDGFESYMDSKIEKYNAVAAIDRMSGRLNGILAYSHTNNSITFFAISTSAVFNVTAEKLLTVALRQLDTHKMITAWLPETQETHLKKAVDAFLNFGFIIKGTGHDAGVRGYDLVRPETNERRGGSFHYNYLDYAKYSRHENCPCCNNAPMPDGNIDIAELEYSVATAERSAQGRLFGKCHVLIKNHYVNFEDISREDMAGYMGEVQLVGAALRRVSGAVKINYEIHANSGPHIHCHLFPRYLDDDFPSTPIDYRITELSPYESDEEFEWFVERMREELKTDENDNCGTIQPELAAGI